MTLTNNINMNIGNFDSLVAEHLPRLWSQQPYRQPRPKLRLAQAAMWPQKCLQQPIPKPTPTPTRQTPLEIGRAHV